jgi:hypothetical protein
LTFVASAVAVTDPAGTTAIEPAAAKAVVRHSQDTWAILTCAALHQQRRSGIPFGRPAEFDGKRWRMFLRRN